MLTEFGKVLRKIRIDHNEILKNMADKLDVTVSYLSAIENGKREVPNGWVERIAQFYDLSENDINIMYEALYNSKKKVSIDLENLNGSKRQAAIAFAREFNDLSEEDVRDILKMLKKMKEV
nr:MAG TPA: helix-turn-helix domain protein [Caudoviricetes sp.]